MQTLNYEVANSDGQTYRLAVNEALKASTTSNSGTIAPSNPEPYMDWLDVSTSPPVLKRRNAANLGWEVPSITTSTIVEAVANGGVTVDGVLLKDGLVAGKDPANIVDPDALTTATLVGTEVLALKQGGTWKKATVDEVVALAVNDFNPSTSLPDDLLITDSFATKRGGDWYVSTPEQVAQYILPTSVETSIEVARRYYHTLTVGVGGEIVLPETATPRFAVSLTQNGTVEINLGTGTQQVAEFQLYVAQTGAYSLTLPASLKFPEDVTFTMPQTAGSSVIIEAVKYGADAPWLATYLSFTGA